MASEPSTARAILRSRGERLGVSEASYRIYLAVMLTIIVVAPAARAIVLWTDAVLPAPGQGEGLAAAFSMSLTLLTALVVLASAHVGPAQPTLPQIDLLLVSPHRRGRLLAGSLVRGFGLGASAGAVLSGLVCATRLLRGEIDAATTAELLFAGAGVGALGAGAMLLGQLGRSVRAVLAGLLAVCAASQGLREWLLSGRPPAAEEPAGPWAAAMPFDPWSGYGVLVAGDETLPVLAVIALLGSAMLFGCLAPWIVSRLRWSDLRERAERWDVVRVLSASGDARAAFARLGAPVRTGRRLRLRVSRSPLGTIVRRDLLGVIRAPARSIAALLVMLGAGALWTAALAPSLLGGAPDAVPAALLGAAAMLGGHIAVRPWCRGIEVSAEGSGSPPLTPLSVRGLVARHLVVPAALSAVAVTLGAAAALVTVGGGAGLGAGAGSSASRLGWVLVSVLVVALTAVLLRVLDAVKGPLPMKLLAPVPTPAGDLAGINVAVWVLDGPISSLIGGGALGALWATGIAEGGVPVAGLIASVLLIAGLLLWADGRLSSSRSIGG